VLAGDTQRGAVFHQADVVDVRDFRAPDTLVDPAHDIAEDALGVVFQFAADVIGTPVGGVADGDGQQAIEQFVLYVGESGAFQLLLHGRHVDLVIVQGVQGGCGG